MGWQARDVRSLLARVTLVRSFIQLAAPPLGRGSGTAARVSLPRERFWDIPVPKIDSPTRQPLLPDRPALITTPSRTLQQRCSCATPS
ncbi:MAG: hypothetical protein AB2815_02060 [Candidatus Sedimenticola endophacoides]